MKSKIPLIIFVSGIILACIIFIAIITIRFSTKEPSIIETPIITNPTLVPPNIPIPTGKTIEVSGVNVKNPYENTVKIDTQGDSLMQENPGYSLVYLRPFNEFLISITASPFEKNRKLAEEAFLLRMGITQTDSCRLKVTITTPLSINPNEAGQSYPLSFCQ